MRQSTRLIWTRATSAGPRGQQKSRPPDLRGQHVHRNQSSTLPKWMQDHHRKPVRLEPHEGHLAAGLSLFHPMVPRSGVSIDAYHAMPKNSFPQLLQRRPACLFSRLDGLAMPSSDVAPKVATEKDFWCSTHSCTKNPQKAAPRSGLLQPERPRERRPVEAHDRLIPDDGHRGCHGAHALQLVESRLVFGDVAFGEFHAVLTEKLLRPAAE